MLHVDLPPVGCGGVAYQVDLLAATLAGRGHDITVFITHEPPVGRPYRTVQLPVPFRSPTLRRQLGPAKAFASVDLSGFDVVHAHGDDWGVRRGIPRVRTFYGTALMECFTATSWGRRGAQIVHYGLEWLAGARASTSVTISRHTCRYLPFVTRCIPCAFDPEVFGPGTRRDSVPTILFVAGVLRGRKRGQIMLDAFADVRRAVPEAQLHIVSTERVDAPGVICHRALDPKDLVSLYRRSWLLCSTSSYEGFGVPYIEAMATGVPVVSTPNPGATEVLEQGRLGVLSPPSELGDRLVTLLGDEAARQQLTDSGLEAAGQYAAPSVAAAYERVYEQLKRP
jgi:glycosyltransferase involved in cell wall biosynthesis